LEQKRNRERNELERHQSRRRIGDGAQEVAAKVLLQIDDTKQAHHTRLPLHRHRESRTQERLERRCNSLGNVYEIVMGGKRKENKERQRKR
jgi:hypothetical protein